MRPQFWQAWGALLHTAKTGESAFAYVHGLCTDCWEYLAQHPQENQVFNAAMREVSRTLEAAVVDAYDFSAAACVVDVGDGQGKLLSAILSANPTLHGVLFDQPHVVAGAGPILHAAGVADLYEIVGGSFFEGIPCGSDVYLLQHIIHN